MLAQTSRWFGSFLVIVLLSVAALLLRAETNEAPKILFVHARIEKGKDVQLVDMVVREGSLKPTPHAEQKDGLHYELLTKDGQSLWHGAMHDPVRRVVEYEDPPYSGRLKRKQIELSDAEITIRVPLTTNAHRVQFYSLTASGTNGVVQTNKLGSVIIPKK